MTPRPRPARPHKSLAAPRRAVVALLLVAVAALGGCNWIGYAAHAIGGGSNAQKVWVDAQYAGLQNKTFAVLVGADEYTLGRYPNAPLHVGKAVSIAVASRVAGARPMDPKQVAEFQNNNLYWNTLPYGDLIKRLNVDRLVLIDLVQYSTNEPGNQHVWQGVVVANVGVVEAESTNPNDQVYANTVRVVFPPDKPAGVLDADEQSIQLGMLKLFSEAVANLFHEHQREQAN